jgi:3-oxoacyl-[acyl-carrier protein] reductase
VSIVTGAAQGIGKDIARLLAASGDRVVVADLLGPLGDEVAAEIVAEGGTALAVCADISQPTGVKEVMAATLGTYGAVDVVVNNAALTTITEPLELEPEEWDLVIDSSLRGSFLVSQAAARWMIAERRSGVVIHISSVQAHRPWAKNWPYAAAKGGLLSMGRAMAQYLGGYGIRVCVVSPGAIGRGVLDPRYPPPGREAIERDIPLRRVGTCWDVAHAVKFLCSEEASYITGAELSVDGGLLYTGPEV